MAHLIPRSLVGVLLAVVALVGCGNEPAAETEPSSAVSACRTAWQELITDWETRADSAFPSDLAGRWAALAAGGAYQSTAADDNCQAELDRAEVKARSVERLSGSLRSYDLAWQYAEIREAAAGWIVEAHATKGEDARAKRRAARQAQRALDQVDRFAPLAATDMDAAWQAAVQADLADPDAMRDLADSMAFVAADSAPYRKGSKALSKVQRLISRR